MAIDPGTAIGAVHLRVSDLERSLRFYAHTLGLDTLARDDATAVLGSGGAALVAMRLLPGAIPRPRRSTGLYHFAVLVPDRASLGEALGRLVAMRWPLQGASDHGVSEALYLADPDGLGIEIYRDRPRAEWPRAGEGQGLAMVTDPLDLRALLDDAVRAGAVPARMPAGTRMGHVHLQVRDLDAADAFYHGALGFDVMQRLAGSALFVSAGGYHHHLGLNTWGVAGAPPAPVTAPGLDYVEVVLPNAPALDAVRRSLAERGAALEARDGGWLVHDPSSNAVLLRTV
jgi:catechol 2,3-dioxygenase